MVAGSADLAKQEIDINVFHTRKQVDPFELATATGTGLVLRGVAPGHRGTHVEVRNGYRYTLDSRGRPTRIEGWLVLNSRQARDNAAQLRAGGKDRKPTDVGGHYVARRFNGPLDDFNHFAQDGDFNNGSYKALENKWQKALASGKQVYVVVKPSYPRDSLRPSKLEIVYTIDGIPKSRKFVNGPGVR